MFPAGPASKPGYRLPALAHDNSASAIFHLQPMHVAAGESQRFWDDMHKCKDHRSGPLSDARGILISARFADLCDPRQPLGANALTSGDGCLQPEVADVGPETGLYT